MKAGMKRILTKTLLAAVMLMAVLGMLPATSHASAYGVSYWSGFNVNIGGQTVKIPGGQLAHMISGSGYYIKWDGANFASAGNLCDSSMRFTYGYGAYYLKGNVHWGCSHVGQWKYYLNNWKAPRGSACAELWAKNWRVRIARQCHYVHG